MKRDKKRRNEREREKFPFSKMMIILLGTPIFLLMASAIGLIGTLMMWLAGVILSGVTAFLIGTDR